MLHLSALLINASIRSSPVCGMPLAVGLLEITEEDGEGVMLITFDCPTNDFHRAPMKAEVIEMLAREVVRQLNR